jgi:hypothetical protein
MAVRANEAQHSEMFTLTQPHFRSPERISKIELSRNSSAVRDGGDSDYDAMGPVKSHHGERNGATTGGVHCLLPAVTPLPSSDPG